MTDKERMDEIKGLHEDYKKVFNSEEGKRVLAHLAKNCFIKTTTLDKDVNIMAAQEGARMVYLNIETMISLDIDKIEKESARQ